MAKPLYEMFMDEKNTPLKESYIRDSFELMIGEEPSLKPYIEDFRVVKSIDRVLGTYSKDNRMIKINKECLDSIDGNKQLMALKAVRREIEHARNLKTLLEGRDDIESLVVGYSLRDYAMKEGISTSPNLDRIYPDFLTISKNMNQETDPAERLADIKAWKFLVNFLKNQRRTDDLLTARTMLYYSYIRGYKDNRYYLDAPTYEFLLKTGMHHEHYWLKNRVEKKDYSFDTRLTYGLPITYPEYEEKVLKKVLLQKRER